jgi:hypothetical protein
VLPTTVVIAVAVVFPVGGPELAGFKVTDTFAAGILPDGKPEPVTVMFVTPAWPTMGEVGELRVTVGWPGRGGNPTDTSTTTSILAIADRTYHQDFIALKTVQLACEDVRPR